MAKEPLCLCFWKLSPQSPQRVIRCSGLTFPQSEALSSAFPGPCSSCLLLTSSAPRDKQTLAKPQTEVLQSYPHPPLQSISELPLSWGRVWNGELITFPFPSLPCTVVKRARKRKG